MEPIRVLQVFAQLDRGGAESMLMTLYRSIDRSKVQFDFVANESDHEYAFADEIRSLGGKIYYVPKYRIINSFAYKHSWRKLFDTHNEWKIVQAHHTTPAFIYLKLAKSIGCFTIAHSHTSSGPPNLKSLIKVSLRKRLANIVNSNFACSVAAGKWMFGNRSFKVLNNAIKTSDFVFNPFVRKKVIDEFSLNEGYIIGHIGRFSEEKNHTFLIDIFYEVHKQNDKAQLMLVGDGSLKSEVEKKVKRLELSDFVIFTGIRTDVSRLLQAVDIFLFPSLYEGFPVTLVEAQASGLPCLVSDTVTDEVKVTDMMEFISLKQPASVWAEKALDMAKNNVRKDMSEEIVKAGFDVHETARWLEEFYLSKSKDPSVSQ